MVPCCSFGMMRFVVFVVAAILSGSKPCLSSSDALASTADLHYNLIPRSSSSSSSNRVTSPQRDLLEATASLAPSASPPLVSFDGDLDAIYQLALAKASRSSVRDSFSCDDQETVALEIINWKYAIETVPKAVIPTVYGEVQEIALEHVAPNLLSCLNESAAYADIVALDTAIPGDHASGGTLFGWLLSMMNA
jgi:hypothetical protein